MNHQLYECAACQQEGCRFSEGGLGFCPVCKGVAGSLTSSCTRRPLPDAQGRLVQGGSLDFKDGKWVRFGLLAREFCKKHLPLEVLKSHAGFYIGTSDEGLPCSRESVEYFRSMDVAATALETDNWTQKTYP